MQHTILISPDLKISPRQVAQAWNADAECKKLAIAEVNQSQTKSFDPTLGEILTFVVVSAASGVIGNAVYDLLKELIQSQLPANAPKREIILNHIRQPDGTEVTIVHYKE